jgi:hypothetical protein
MGTTALYAHSHRGKQTSYHAASHGHSHKQGLDSSRAETKRDTHRHITQAYRAKAFPINISKEWLRI